MANKIFKIVSSYAV